MLQGGHVGRQEGEPRQGEALDEAAIAAQATCGKAFGDGGPGHQQEQCLDAEGTGDAGRRRQRCDQRERHRGQDCHGGEEHLGADNGSGHFRARPDRKQIPQQPLAQAPGERAVRPCRQQQQRHHDLCQGQGRQCPGEIREPAGRPRRVEDVVGAHRQAHRHAHQQPERRAGHLLPAECTGHGTHSAAVCGRPLPEQAALHRLPPMQVPGRRRDGVGSPRHQGSARHHGQPPDQPARMGNRCEQAAGRRSTQQQRQHETPHPHDRRRDHQAHENVRDGPGRRGGGCRRRRVAGCGGCGPGHSGFPLCLALTIRPEGSHGLQGCRRAARVATGKTIDRSRIGVLYIGVLLALAIGMPFCTPAIFLTTPRITWPAGTPARPAR